MCHKLADRIVDRAIDITEDSGVGVGGVVTWMARVPKTPERVPGGMRFAEYRKHEAWLYPLHQRDAQPLLHFDAFNHERAQRRKITPSMQSHFEIVGQKWMGSELFKDLFCQAGRLR